MDAQPTEADVRYAAMDLLARREHSRAELGQKLEQRFARQRARAERRRVRREDHERAHEQAREHAREQAGEDPSEQPGERDDPRRRERAGAAHEEFSDGPGSDLRADVGADSVTESGSIPGALPANVVEAALERLESEGLLSDSRFAEAFVRSRIARGQGPVRLRHELRRRGLDAAHIDLALESAEVDWNAHAEDVLLRRFGDSTPVDARDRARRIRFLQQRGFSFEACHKLLK